MPATCRSRWATRAGKTNNGDPAARSDGETMSYTPGDRAPLASRKWSASKWRRAGSRFSSAKHGHALNPVFRDHIMTIWSYLRVSRRTFPLLKPKARFSALLAEVEAGEEIAVTRHGKIGGALDAGSPAHGGAGFSRFLAGGWVRSASATGFTS